MTTTTDPHIYTSLGALMALECEGQVPDFHGRLPRYSILAGPHATRLRGRGLTFDELRPYQPGDDPRHLDWRATLRTGQIFVRQYSEERDRPTLVVCDQRMDMFFGSCRVFKSVTAAELAALVAWAAFSAGDRVGGLVFNDQQLEQVRPHRSRTCLQQLFASVVRQNHQLHASNPVASKADRLDQALALCLAAAHHDHTICLVSDFSGAGVKTLHLLRQLARHNDVIALQVYDPIALELPRQGRIRISEGNVQVSLDIGRPSIRQPISDFLQGRLQEVATLLRQSRIPHLMISTGEATGAQFRQFLGAARRWS